jgi:hypothetical protein
MLTPLLHVMMLAAAVKKYFTKGYKQINKQQLSDELST